MTIRPRRSVLYMPGSNARAIEKARTLPADGVILDLEDAVAPDAKSDARRQVSEAVKAGGFGPREIFIRVNAIDTPWHNEDLAAAVQATPDAILVPKISKPAEIEMLGRRLLDLGANPKTRLWAMIETPLAILDIHAIAATAKMSQTRLSGFVLGTNDLAKETGTRFVPARWTMLPWLSISVLAARAYNLSILDGVYNDLSDMEGFTRECAQGRDFGMDGKTLIHPNQIAPCNEAFSPTAEEIAQAQKIIAAFDLPENRDKGVVQIDGRMVERLHADIARKVVAIDDAIAARGG
jgi:citrate lyase subunit beta/citryl-CoA lyase